MHVKSRKDSGHTRIDTSCTAIFTNPILLTNPIIRTWYLQIKKLLTLLPCIHHFFPELLILINVTCTSPLLMSIYGLERSVYLREPKN